MFQATPTAERLGLLWKIALDKYPHFYISANVNQSMNVAEVTRSLKRFSVCYSIKLKPGFNSFNTTSLVGGRFSTTIYYYKVNYDAIPNAANYMLYVSAEKDDFLDANEAFIEISLKLGTENRVAFTYMVYRIYSLPPPYPTRCLEYNNIGFKSQKHCRHECVVREVRSRSIRMPPSVKISETNLRKEKPSLSRFHMDAMHSVIDDICNQKCWQPNCQEETFVAKAVSKMSSPSILWNMVAPDSPTVLSTYSPKLGLVDFGILVFSCFSFWLSVCPLGFLLDQQLLLNKACESRLGMQVNERHTSVIVPALLRPRVPQQVPKQQSRLGPRGNWTRTWTSTLDGLASFLTNV